VVFYVYVHMIMFNIFVWMFLCCVCMHALCVCYVFNICAAHEHRCMLKLVKFQHDGFVFIMKSNRKGRGVGVSEKRVQQIS